ncbi:MAG TPA: hypothetical protein VE442_17570, partial [Jatrophihabitans sp.]|nr:hypothetical protein [Jatrophihabitans sp.]
KPVLLAKPGAAAGSAQAGATPLVLPGWLRWAPAGILSAGVVAMAVVLIVFSNGVWWARPAGNTIRQEVLAAAKTCLAAQNTYKYTDLDAYEQRALGCTTGHLHTALHDAIETLVKKKAPKLHASQTAQINRAGIVSISSDGRRWTILVFAQLGVVNTNFPKGRVDPFAARVIMEKVGDRWLATEVDEVSTPVG